MLNSLTVKDVDWRDGRIAVVEISAQHILVVSDWANKIRMTRQQETQKETGQTQQGYQCSNAEWPGKASTVDMPAFDFTLIKSTFAFHVIFVVLNSQYI